MAFLKNAPDVSPEKKTGYTFRGQEIILCKSRGNYTWKTGLMAKGIQKGMFPDEKKVEAATIYAVTGSLPRTSELTGIPEHTLRSWRQTDTFKELLREVWAENNEKIDAKFTAIIEKSLEAIIDRLDHGDFRLTSKGELKRVPINAKELSLVQAINVDKRQLLRGLPTSRPVDGDPAVEKTVNRLEKLAETFESLARIGRKPKIIDITDAEILENKCGGAHNAQSTESGGNGGGTPLLETERLEKEQV